MPGGAGAQNGKGAQSDPNYVSRLLVDCVPIFHKIITPAGAGGGKNYSYATVVCHSFCLSVCFSDGKFSEIKSRIPNIQAYCYLADLVADHCTLSPIAET